MDPIIQNAVTNALATQPWWVRRKDTITAIAGTVLQMLNILVAYTTTAPEWASIALAVAIGVCQVIIHAGTPGAITPSMATRLDAATATGDAEEGYEAGVTAARWAGEPTPNPDDEVHDAG